MGMTMGTAKAGPKAIGPGLGLYRASLAHIWPIAFSLSELRMPAGRRGRCSRLNSWYGLVYGRSSSSLGLCLGMLMTGPAVPAGAKARANYRAKATARAWLHDAADCPCW